jgi:hypothetical protein
MRVREYHSTLKLKRSRHLNGAIANLSHAPGFCAAFLIPLLLTQENVIGGIGHAVKVAGLVATALCGAAVSIDTLYGRDAV